MSAEPKLRATIPVPDHSDLRGFSYRAPINTEGYNDAPKKGRPEWKGWLQPRKARRGFWAGLAGLFRGKKDTAERPLSPELVTRLRASEPPARTTEEEYSPRPPRDHLPQDRDASPLWPG